MNKAHLLASGCVGLVVILILVLGMKRYEPFESEGERIMRHVDPMMGGGGLLVPIVRS